MNLQNRLLTAVAVMAVAVLIPSARALVSLEDGRDRLYVDGTVEIGYDSNVFANAKSGGSMLVEGSLGAEFARRAGWIGVDATASLTFARFANFREQNYLDPALKAVFSKQTGRTTGSIVVSAQRENRADVDVNTRDVSWNYDVGLNIEYPVIERYSFSGSFDYTFADYQNQQLFTNLATYTGNLYLYYILDEQRDFFVDYRTRYSGVGNGTDDVDNSLSAGVNGRIYGPFNGSIQAGYQERSTRGGPAAASYSDLTASGAMTWNLNRRLSLAADLSRDFSTTAQAQSIDSTRVGLTFKDSITAKASATLQGAAGQNRFLGPEGLLSPGGRRRIDNFASIDASYFYTINERIKISINFVYFENWSTLAYAQFPRSQVNMSLISHW
ncbi:MAG TPA: hypothetical protein VKG78_08535 [Opitutaceae bacterium]|nr:hypothetical protein [Opitutaceae bacterium]